MQVFDTNNSESGAAFLDGCHGFDTFYPFLYMDKTADKACRIWADNSAKHIDLVMRGCVWYDANGAKLSHSGDFSVAPKGFLIYDEGGIYSANYKDLHEVLSYVYYPIGHDAKL